MDLDWTVGGPTIPQGATILQGRDVPFDVERAASRVFLCSHGCGRDFGGVGEGAPVVAPRQAAAAAWGGRQQEPRASHNGKWQWREGHGVRAGRGEVSAMACEGSVVGGAGAVVADAGG